MERVVNKFVFRAGARKVTLESIKCVKLLQDGQLQLKSTCARRGACRNQYIEISLLVEIRFVFLGDPDSLVST